LTYCYLLFGKISKKVSYLYIVKIGKNKMAKDIIYDNVAKDKILVGVNKLEKAVSVTLGPCGKNVIIDEYGSIHSTKDGVTVAKSVVLKDAFENLGANAVKEVAQKSNDMVGDGTTTSTVLAAAIFKNGLKHVNVGANATQVKNGIRKAADMAVEVVKKNSIKISSKEDIERVATVSANGDQKIGKIIAEVMSKIGNDGTIKVEDGNTSDITSKIVEGMVIDQSYASPYMVTNAETMEVELENPWILLANKKLANLQEMVGSLNSVAQTGRPLLIIADDFADDVLGTLIFNRMKSGFVSVAVKSPSYGDNRKLMLEDIAILTGGKVISDETGIKIEDAVIESGIVGQAKRVIINKENTVIIDGVGSSEAIESRASALRTQIENCSEEYDKEKLQERLAKLTSGIGIISVGAVTKAEQKELRDRVDDAFSAAKAALKSGIVAGGGSALLNVKREVAVTDTFVGDEAIGASIFLNSLDAPIRKILENAGLDASYVVQKLLDSPEYSANTGYDVLTNKYVNMVESGIIDPTEVVLNEIQNAASIAGLLLTTECLIVDEQLDKSGSSSGSCSTCGGHGGMPMM
jgi:chaperonin GroEL